MLPPQLSLIGRAPVRGLLGAPLPPAGRFDRGGDPGRRRRRETIPSGRWCCMDLWRTGNTRLEGALPVANISNYSENFL